MAICLNQLRCCPFLLKKAKFNILAGRKAAAFVSILLISFSWYIFLNKGEDNFGVDFTGGTVATYKFDQKQDIEVIRGALEKAGYPNAGITCEIIRRKRIFRS